MVNDQEPRYRLVDENGNVVGSFFAESDGTLKLQEGTSGNDNEAVFTPDGVFKPPTIRTNELLHAPHTQRRVVGPDGRTEIYVDASTGDDNADGTQSNPVQTVQEAFDRVPIVNPGQTIINVAPGTYDEDLVVGGQLQSATARELQDEPPRDGITSPVAVIGDTSTPSNVEIGSAVLGPTVGSPGVTFNGVRWLRDSPQDNETSAVIAYGPGQTRVKNCEYASSATIGLTAYRGATGDVRSCDWDNLDHGVKAKGTGSTVVCRDCIGTTNEQLAVGIETGTVVLRSNVSATGSPLGGLSTSRARVESGGLVRDAQNGHAFTNETTIDGTRETQQISSGEIDVTAGLLNVAGEGGADDDLDTINGGVQGQRVTLQAANQDITVTENDNIRLSTTPFTLVSAADTLSLIYDGVNWIETGRSDR